MTKKAQSIQPERMSMVLDNNDESQDKNIETGTGVKTNTLPFYNSPIRNPELEKMLMENFEQSPE